jgi:hypothetical protein
LSQKRLGTKLLVTFIDRLTNNTNTALVPVALSTFAAALAARRRGHDSISSLLALGTGGLLAAGGEYLVTAITESDRPDERAVVYDFHTGKVIG